jgi:hypothetical protein
VLSALAAGLTTGPTWLPLFGAIFIGEELLETGVMILALRSSSEEARR